MIFSIGRAFDNHESDAQRKSGYFARRRVAVMVRPLTQEARQRQVVALDVGLRAHAHVARQRAGRRVVMTPGRRIRRRLRVRPGGW